MTRRSSFILSMCRGDAWGKSALCLNQDKINHLFTTLAPVRHVICCLVVCTGLCLVPFMISAIIAISFYRLDGDATVLRPQVQAATDGSWSTKLQLNLGQATLKAANFGLRFIKDEKLAAARPVLAAIKRASVGVTSTARCFRHGPRKNF